MRLIQIAGLIVALAALAVTIYFSIRSERTKELTLTYLGKRSLISSEAVRPAGKVEVRVNSNVIKDPWIVSLRVQNTGSIAIEERDIEAPLALDFSDRPVISAEIATRSQPSLAVTSAVAGSTVKLAHKLLNPGDHFNVDIVLDGEPKLPAPLTCRISGVTSPKQILTPTEPTKQRIVVGALPRPLIYLVLIVASITAMAFFAAGFGMAGTQLSYLLRKRPEPAPVAIKLEKLWDDAAILVDGSDRSSKVILPFLDGQLSAAVCRNPTALRKMIEQKVPPAVLQSVGLDVASAVEVVVKEHKRTFRARVARELFMKLRSPSDRQARDEVMGIPTDALSCDTLNERIESLLLRYRVADGAAPDMGNMIAGIFIAAGGVAMLLILIASWQNMSAS